MIWVPPHPDECEESYHDYPLDDAGHDILYIRMLCDHRDRFVDFAIMHKTGTGTNRKEVARADTHDGVVHWHLFSRAGEQIKWERLREIHEQRDIEDGYDESLDLLMGSWEENKRRWAGGA